MVQTVIKTGILCISWDESGDYLIIDWAMTGVSARQAYIRNLGTCRSDEKA